MWPRWWQKVHVRSGEDRGKGSTAGGIDRSVGGGAMEDKQVLTSEEKTLFQNEATGQSKARRPLV